MTTMPGSKGAMRPKKQDTQIRGSVFLFNSCMPYEALSPMRSNSVAPTDGSPSLPSVTGKTGPKTGAQKHMVGLAFASGFGAGIHSHEGPRKKIGPISESEKALNNVQSFFDAPEQSLMWRETANKPRAKPRKDPGLVKTTHKFQDLVTGEVMDDRLEGDAENPSLYAIEASVSPNSTSMPTLASPTSQISRPESYSRWPESPRRWNDRSPTEIDDDELTLECLDESRSRPWNAAHWLEVRSQMIDFGKVKELPLLMKSVRASSERALKLEEYQLDGFKSVDLSKYLQPAESIRWFGRRNVMVPQMPAGLQNGTIEPPIIVVDQSPLDIVRDLQTLNREDRRPICVVLEVSSFEKNGTPNLNGHGKAFMTNQNDCLVRTDFMRFAHVASGGLRGAKCSVRDHLVAQHDPYVVVCPNMTMFRGSREEGYRFMEQPMHITTICCSMPSSRPAVTVSSNYGTGERTEWYSSDADQTALLERLSLMGFSALQGHTHLEDCDAEKKAILILSALGCADRGLHPKDAVANSLKHWRTRFARLFHTVFLACGPDRELAEHFDLAINRQLYGALLVEDVSNFAEWHWERSHCAMHINSMDFGILAEMVQDVKDEKVAEKEAKEAEENLKRQREEEETEARQSEERERQKMALEDKYDTVATCDIRSTLHVSGEMSITLSAFSDDSASPPARQGPPATANSPLETETKNTEEEEEEEVESETAFGPQASLLDEFSDAMTEHSKHKAKDNLLDRQVDHLYKESRFGAGGMNTKSRSRAQSVCLGGSLTVSRAASFSGASNRSSVSRRSTNRIRPGSAASATSAMSDSRTGGSRSGSCRSNRSDGSDSQDSGGARSNASFKRENSLSVSQESFTGRSSCISFAASGTPSRGRISSARISVANRMSISGRRVSAVEKKVMQSRMSAARAGNPRLVPTSSSHGQKTQPKKEMTDAQRIEQVRAEARKRLSCKKDTESHTVRPSPVVSQRGSFQPMQASIVQSVAASVSNAPIADDPDANKDEGNVLLTVMELPKFEGAGAADTSRRSSFGSDPGSTGVSRRASAEATEQPGVAKSGTQETMSSTFNETTAITKTASLTDNRSSFEDDGTISFSAAMTEPAFKDAGLLDRSSPESLVPFAAVSTVSDGVSSKRMYGDEASDDDEDEITIDLLDNRAGRDFAGQQKAGGTTSATEGEDTVHPLLDTVMWGNFAASLAPIYDDVNSRGQSLISIPSKPGSKNATPRASNATETTEMSSNPSSKARSKIGEKLQAHQAKDTPDQDSSRLRIENGILQEATAPATDQQRMPEKLLRPSDKKEEWQVRRDVQQLAAAFKQRTEVFWSSPSRRRKVAMMTPHTQRMPGRRNSNQMRGHEALVSLETAAEEEAGERQMEAEIMRAAAATPHRAMESHPWQRHYAISAIAKDVSSPPSPDSGSVHQALPPLKEKMLRRFSKRIEAGHKDAAKFDSDPCKEPPSPTSTCSGHGAPSSQAWKAVAGGGWPQVARGSVRGSVTGKRLSAERFVSAGPILTELAKVPVDDAHQLADVSATRELSNIMI